MFGQDRSLALDENMQNLPLVAKSVSKKYQGGPWANRDISLTIGPSEVVGILGPNGSGKTTFVCQITTETLPTSGSITVFGMDVVTSPTRAKYMLGIVPQDWIFLWDCSVYHNLRFFGKLRGLTSTAAISRAHELIDELDMSGYQGRHFSTLSGGQRQRVLLAIVSLVPSSLLVLDEPTTGLDPEVRHQVWNYIRRRKAQGSSVLITTHNMEEAETLCDRVGILHNGSMKALDTIADLRSLHAGEFKVTYFLDGTDLGQSKTIYGNDDRDLVAQVQALGVKEFTVSKTTLEDVYLTVVRGNNRTS